MRKGLIIAVTILVVVVTVLSSRLDSTQKESERKDGTINALMDTVTVYKVRDTLNVASKAVLNLTLEELKKHRVKDIKLIEELKLRPKDIEYITKTTIITKDSLVYRIDSLGCFHYKDDWLAVDACIGDSSMIIESRDSIAQIAHAIYKYKFLWWKWKVIGFKQEVVNFNPKSKVIFNEIIRVNIN